MLGRRTSPSRHTASVVVRRGAVGAGSAGCAGGARLSRWLGPVVAAAVVVGAVFPSPALAQMGAGGFNQQQGEPPKEDEYVRPKEALEPLPEPLSGKDEAARERAKEKGVLRAQKAEPGVIYELRIEGSKKIEPDAILVQVQTRIDKQPDRRVIQGDIRRIYAMEVFADVIVEAKEGPSGSIILTYRLVEKPSIDEVLLEGNSDVSKDDIDEVLDIKPFQVLDVPRVRANQQKIQKLYVDKGYFLADVRYEIRKSTGTAKKSDGPSLIDLFNRDDRELADTSAQTPAEADALGEEFKDKDAEAAAADAAAASGGDFVDIVYIISERAKVKVESISFVGNENIPADDLLNVMRTRENHPLGIVTEWGTYKEEGAEIDLLAIEATYQDRGFINVKVGKPRVQLSADKTRISMSIPITEGESYTLRSFDVSGDLLLEDGQEPPADKDAIFFKKSDILDRTRIRSGDVFARSQVALDIQAVAERYRDKGYVYVNILPDTVTHAEDNSLDLILKIESGPRVTIERIEIAGNEKTQDSVIRRELRVYEGEFYSASQLRLSEQRANALGFFEKVTVTTRQGTRPDRMILIFEVKEKSTGTFQVGAGFSNAESFLLSGQIAYNNFLGLGTTVSGQVQWSRLRQIIDVRFIDPYAFYIGQEPITFSVSAFNNQQNFFDFLRNSTGSDVTLGYPVGRVFSPVSRQWLSDAPSSLFQYLPDFENLQLFLTANAERVEIDDTFFNVRLLGLQQNLPRYTTSLRTSVIFDQRNNRLFPSAGWFISGTVELASPFLGSALLPQAEAGLKDALQASGVQDGLGLLKRNGLANNFRRYSLNSRAYYNFDDFSPVKGVVLKVNVDFGLLDASEDLIFENFYLGGFNTIRGYFPRSISPIRRVGSSSDAAGPLAEFKIGGTKRFFTNLELEFPIFEQAGVRGVLFADAGNVYDRDENLFYLGMGRNPQLEGANCQGTCWDARTQLPLGLFYSVGVGVRWFSPLGPLRFEWGVPLTPRPVGTFGLRQGDQPFQFEFNIGNSF